ncbi:hypothetical protein FACS189474_3110 [Bacteroidia bacterium]|nr:hypothetical protein FACS189474_3110 [Bacteroidia bacterium]
MKTSNYIVTAFFVFIFGAMLFLFIAAKNHKEEAWNKTELHFWGEIETVAIEKDASSGYYLNN